MKKSVRFSSRILAVVLLGPLFWGCSEHVATSYNAAQSASVTDYFPLKEGTSIDYTIKNNWYGTISSQRFTVGNAVTMNGLSRYLWLSENHNFPSITDTGFFVASANSLLYYESVTAQPEKILETPLQVGKTWQRFTSTDIVPSQNNLIDLLLGLNEPKGGDSTTGGGGGTFKNFPTLGSNYFIISAIENITLSDGSVYENCLRVENQGGGLTNYYWYAPGFGLVKFANNVSPGSYPDGQLVGEMTGQSAY